jgi:hypothetical protein
MKRLIVTLPLLAMVAACSQSDNERAKSDTEAPAATEAVADAASEADTAQPRIGANVAPGVAFDYRYDFALPQTEISAVQSRHAALCEDLTIRHCRVTGMTFNRDDQGEVTANLAFKLDPAMVGRFGRDATGIVEAVDGRLSDSAITGEDVGSGIVEDDKTLAGIDAELAKIDAQLKIPNLSKAVRGRLIEQANDLRAQRRDVAKGRDTKVESLATTPVAFNYRSGEGVLGLDERSAVSRSLKTSGQSLMVMLEVVMTMVGALAPWALLAGGVWWIVRRLRRKPVASAE